MRLRLSSLLMIAMTFATILCAQQTPTFYSWAARPPMGWNSWDCYGSSVVESEVRANAQYMADNLLAFGWEYVVIDIRWYVDNPGAHGYTPFNQTQFNYNSDGIMTPSQNRFPSATDGTFTQLASDIHGMGLKFGLHMMRGINRQFYDSVNKSETIGSTSYTFGDLVTVANGAFWLNDNYGLEKNDAAQAWYDLMIETYASWGLDFIKVDDLSAPAYRTGEVEMLRNAIDKVYNDTGHRIVLSTSPGPTADSDNDFAVDPAIANHVRDHANMWRITNDLWDNWGNVYDMFERSNNWTPYRGDGHFPDNDMLPLGRLGIRAHVGSDRMSNLTQNEQRTLMTLWSITRSPLMFGGDLPSNDAFTLSLLNNAEVLAVNRDSEHSHQLYRMGDRVVWVADDELSSDKFLAILNTGASTDNVPVDLGALGFTGSVQVRSLWDQMDLGSSMGLFSASIPPHGAQLYRLSGPVLPTPWITDVTADEVSATVTWEAIPSATSYTLKRGVSEAGPFTSIIASGLTNAFHTDITVVERTTYYYVVSAVVSGLETPNSPSRAVTIGGVPTTVSWNFDRFSTIGGNGAGEFPGPSAAAGAVSTVNWTNSWPSDPKMNLIDGTGFPTTVDINYSGSGWSVVGFHPGQDSNGSWNKEMLNGYLNAGGGASSTLTISQIPHGSYDIVVYFSSDVAGRTGSVSDGTTIYYFSTIGTSSVTGSDAILTRTTDTAMTYPSANYAVFENLSGTDQTITCTIPQGGGIAAFQIVPLYAEFITLTATPGVQQVALTWNRVAGATSYTVWRSLMSGGPYFEVDSGVTDSTYTDMGLNDGDPYFYMVSAEYAGQEIASSFEVTATPGAASDWFTELFSAADNDTDFTTFTFIPANNPNGYVVFSAQASAFPTDPAGGTALSLSDDSSQKVTLTGGAQVSLYGTSYTSFYVGSNGYITFNGGDSTYSESFSNHFSQPRISGLLDDLNPNSGGTISWRQLADRVAVTWQGVPEYGASNSNDLQIEMYFDGRIRITCLGIDATDGLIGLSRGTGTPSGFVESSFSLYPEVPPVTEQELQGMISRLNEGDWTWTVDFVASVFGHSYQLQYSPDLLGPWQNIGPARQGNGATLLFAVPIDPSATRSFYRILIFM